MVRGRHLLLVALALLVGGCAAISGTWDDWFGEEPPRTPTPAAAGAAQREEVFYAASDGLAMHSLPSGSSAIVARLALHQRVTRTGLTRGYANVTTESGLVGWVDNAQLLWRLPVTPGAATTPAVPAAGEGAPAPAVAVETVEPVAATPEVAADTPLPTATEVSAPPPTATPAAAPTKAGAAPAIFDPF